MLIQMLEILDRPVSSVPSHIHLGVENWLFLVSGSNNVLDQYANNEKDKANRREWRRLIEKREKLLRSSNIIYKHAVIPEKLSIYDNFVEVISYDPHLSPARNLYIEDQACDQTLLGRANFVRTMARRRRWRRTVIDLVGPMRRARDSADLYYRTDSHWSSAGRMIAYQEICKAFGAPTVDDLYQRNGESFLDYSGDLGGACVPPITEKATWHYVQRDAVRVYANPIVQYREHIGQVGSLHTGSHAIFRNDKAPDPRKMFLFGDSYSHVAPIMLTAMLAETFRELHFVWSTSLDLGMIERVKPDLVLSAMAERFMYRLPHDETFDLKAYTDERFGAELAGTGFDELT